MNLNIDPEWLRQMADAEDAVGGISIGSVENVVEAENKNNFNLNGKTIANFEQVSDRSIHIEFDDGTEVTIGANINYNSYDEEWGKYVEEAYLEIKVY